MEDNRKKVPVTILGSTYNILTDEDPARVGDIAGYVDRTIKETKAAAPQLSVMQAAVLSLMNLAEEKYSMQDIIDEMRDREADFEKNLESVKEAEELKLELANCENRMKTLKARADKLQAENLELRDMLDEYKDKYNALRTEYELNKRTLNDLQNKFLENQIELVKAKKSLIEAED